MRIGIVMLAGRHVVGAVFWAAGGATLGHCSFGLDICRAIFTKW